MDRLWAPSLLFGLLVLGIWRYQAAVTGFYRPEHDLLFLGGGVYASLFGLFAFFARNMGYVRPFERYLLVATPFFRFKTSYKRLRGVRSTDFYRIFDVEHLTWAHERYITPIIGATVVVVKLSKYPLSTRLLQSFFGKFFLSPQDSELVFIVPDWLSLSVELDSRYNGYRDERRARKQQSGFQRGAY